MFPQQDPDPYVVLAQVLVTLVLIHAAVLVSLSLFALVGFTVHRTADSPSRRTVAVLAAIASIVAVIPPVIYALSRIYGW